MIAILLFVLIVQVDELKPGVVSQPQERAVRYVVIGDTFAKQNLVRLLPVEVHIAKRPNGKELETIRAKCLDERDPFTHRWILASDFAGEDRKWFESEAARLWHNQKIEEEKNKQQTKH
jgi:hypothetical protein